MNVRGSAFQGPLVVSPSLYLSVVAAAATHAVRPSCLSRVQGWEAGGWATSRCGEEQQCTPGKSRAVCVCSHRNPSDLYY